MANISTWSTIADDNDAAPPDGFPEGMKRSDINDSSREYMAAIRRQHEDFQWFDYGDVPTRTGNTTFTVPNDQTSKYTIGRRIKCVDSADLFGTVASAVFSSVTTVTVILDSGNLSASLTSVALAIITPTDPAFTGMLGSLQIDPSQLKYLAAGDPEIIDVNNNLDTAIFLPINSHRKLITVKNSRSSGNIWLRQNPSLVGILNHSNTLAWKIPAGASLTAINTSSTDWKFLMQSPTGAAIRRSAHMVKFNGTDNYIYRRGGTAWFTSLLAGPTGLASIFFRKTGTTIIFDHGGRVILQISGGKLELYLANTANTRNATMTGTTTLVDGQIYHVMLQWDTNAAAGAKTLRMYLDGVDESPVVSDTFPAFDVGYDNQFGNTSGPSFSIGSEADPVTPSTFFSGAISVFYYAPNQSIDISNPSNLQKWRTTNGEPADIGPTGGVPTGSSPLICLLRSAGSISSNTGTGGSLVTNGTFTDSEDGP